MTPAATIPGAAPLADPPALTPERVFPLPRTEDDPRFTIGLLSDVNQALVIWGYPKLTARDLVQLQLAFFGFLYESTEGAACR